MLAVLQGEGGPAASHGASFVVCSRKTRSVITRNTDIIMSMPKGKKKKGGLSPDAVQDLRRQFRLSTVKKASAEKGTPEVRKKTSKGKGGRNWKRIDDRPTPSKYKEVSVSKDAPDDEPTEFERVPNAKPATFKPDWHKFPVPLDQLPSNVKKKRHHHDSAKKGLGKKSSMRRRAPRNTESHIGSAENLKPARTECSVGVRRKEEPTASTAVRSAGGKKTQAETAGRRDARKKRVSVAHKDVSKMDQTTKVSKTRTDSCMPPSSFVQIWRPSTELPTKPASFVPVKDAKNIKLKPVVGSKESVMAVDDEVTAPELEDVPIGSLPALDTKLLDMEKFGNANFSLVDASTKVMEYCSDNNLFKEFLEPTDFAIFTEFFNGAKEHEEKIVPLLDSLIEHILDSKKLASTELTSKPMAVLTKADRMEVKTIMLDALIAKKATVVCDAARVSAETCNTEDTQKDDGTSDQP